MSTPGEMSLDEQLGKNVEITGTAQNAKGGAVVVTEEREVVYVFGLMEWPDEVDGETVKCSGMIVREQFIPEATVVDGAVSTGGEGLDLVLKDAKWDVA